MTKTRSLCVFADKKKPCKIHDPAAANVLHAYNKEAFELQKSITSSEDGLNDRYYYSLFMLISIQHCPLIHVFRPRFELKYFHKFSSEQYKHISLFHQSERPLDSNVSLLRNQLHEDKQHQIWQPHVFKRSVYPVQLENTTRNLDYVYFYLISHFSHLIHLQS